MRRFWRSNFLREDPSLEHPWGIESLNIFHCYLILRMSGRSRLVVLGIFLLFIKIFSLSEYMAKVSSFPNAGKMDRSDNEAGPSTELIPYGPMHYRDIALYPTANNPTHLKKKDIEGFYSEYHIPHGVYRLYMPEPTDRIYHTPPVPASYDDMAIDISESAFKCGFRVHLLRLYKKLSDRWKLSSD